VDEQTLHIKKIRETGRREKVQKIPIEESGVKKDVVRTDSESPASDSGE
jgi:hypothetical protein